MDSQQILPDAVYTAGEAAVLAKLGHTTIVRLARRGDIKAAQVGRTIRITGAALLDFLQGGGSAMPVNAPVDTVVRRLPRQSKRRTGGGGG